MDKIGLEIDEEEHVEIVLLEKCDDVLEDEGKGVVVLSFVGPNEQRVGYDKE